MKTGFCKMYNELIKYPYWRGIGGYYCTCCGPAPKYRKRYRRMARRIAKHRDKKEFVAYGVA